MSNRLQVRGRKMAQRQLIGSLMTVGVCAVALLIACGIKSCQDNAKAKTQQAKIVNNIQKTR